MTRRKELSTFFGELSAQLLPDDARELDRFFKKTAPLLDPSPVQVPSISCLKDSAEWTAVLQSKGDSLDSGLPQKLVALRREIRSLNEQLSKFVAVEIENPRLGSIQLREHYQPVLAMLQELVDKIFTNDDSAAVVREALQFTKASGLRTRRRSRHSQSRSVSRSRWKWSIPKCAATS